MGNIHTLLWLNVTGRQAVAGMKRPWRSMWTLTGIVARPISFMVLALRTSMKGEMFGSGETMDDKITPAGGGGRGSEAGQSSQAGRFQLVV